MTVGTQFGAYRVVSVIGQGGMGVVYLAEDTHLDRRVALKVLAPQYTGDAAFRARFERESRLAASLDHPNVVPVYDAGEIDGVLFIAMRYVAGSDMRVVLNHDGPFTPVRALGIAAQLASALDAAHDLGLIHRDVKPGNVLLAAGHGSDGGEHVYLSDFGLTKRSQSKSGLTQLGTLVGTIDYIAPEQITGSDVGESVDIYALGCVFFEMLAGKSPFGRETDLATMAAHMYEPPPSLLALRPDLHAAIDQTIARVLAKQPADRFATAAAFVRQARIDLTSQSQPPVATDRGATDATVIAPSSAGADESSDDAGHAAAALAAASTVRQPGASPAPAAPPPGSGPFDYGGSVPPSYPPGGPSHPPPPKPRSKVPMAVVLAVVGLGVLLLAAAGFAIISAPRATPTSIAGLPSSATTVAPSGIGSPLVTSSQLRSPSPTPSPPPTSTPTPTPSPPSTPTPTPSPPPTTTPTLLATPVATLDPAAQLRSLLEESLLNCTEEPAFRDVAPVSELACGTDALTQRFALFEAADDLNTAWNWYATDSTDVCKGYEQQTWSYVGDPPDSTRGKVACFISTDNRPELIFTLDASNLLGDYIGEKFGTLKSVTDAWDDDDGLSPSIQ